jgi:hypothetical protein
MESSSESQEEMHDIERSKGAAAAAASALSIDIDSSRFSLEAQSTPLAPSSKKAFFYYIFMSKDALPFIHVEMREDFRCPLCFHDSVSATVEHHYQSRTAIDPFFLLPFICLYILSSLPI